MAHALATGKKYLNIYISKHCELKQYPQNVFVYTYTFFWQAIDIAKNPDFMNKYFLYAIGILFMQSCTRYQCPPDDVFKNRDYTTLKYQKDLVTMLNTVNRKNVDYYIEKYIEENNKQYLLVDINSKELCAYVTMDITDCADFALLKEKKGMSFIGAGLNNPKFHIDSTKGTYQFIIDHIDGIYD